jgi:predicted esterase
MNRLTPAALLLLLPAPGLTQEARYEVGLRLRALERTVEARKDVKARQRTVAPLGQALTAFFTFQLPEVGRHLDRARRALESDEPAPEATRWADSLSVRPATRLLDTSADKLPLTIDHFYKVKADRPEKARVRLTLLTDKGKVAAGPRTIPLAELPHEAALSLKGIGEGDYSLCAKVLVDGKTLARSRQTLSLARRLTPRLVKLRDAVKVPGDGPRSTDALSLKHLVELMTDLEGKKTLETDYPAARLLAEAEALHAALREGRAYHGPARPGRHWLSLAAERPVPARMMVPPGLRKDKPVPLVIALHGAGSSENLFFDGYGAGKIVTLCEKRGWLLVAPRDGLSAGLIKELKRLYPIDPGRIFLVGHSMGAAQAVAAAGHDPTRFAGVAALGGGGGVRTSVALRGVPFFVGIGEADFARSGARALRDRLRKAKVRTVVYKEYPGVEHLLVVQQALDDVFAFLDEAARR